jgi:bifunctional non-homologous end joining protein LigD
MMATSQASAAAASRAVDKQLERYREMRDFDVTAEPRGGSKAKGREQSLPFVVQKHAATRLHYDFRLGWRGVLKSWAVAKGPSFYPGDKRLAVQVEDHPIEYGGFEGTIPKGQYGGGTVMVWDFGDWEPQGDVDEGLKNGHLKFDLRGTKLKGRWALVRMHGHGEREDKPNWLLIKDRDEFAQTENEKPITEKAANSAITKRSIEQIAEQDDHVWNSSAPARDGSKSSGIKAAKEKSAAVNKGNVRPKKTIPTAATLEGLLGDAPREAFPRFIAPQLALQTDKAPASNNWVHELKLDGYRLQIHLRPPRGGKSSALQVTLFTRNGLDWTGRMPEIAQAAAKLDVESAILDGEVVALGENGATSFADLQAAFQDGKRTFLTYYAFDLLHVNGRNVRGLTLLERKDILKRILEDAGDDEILRFSEHLDASGEEIFGKACRLEAEGIVSKTKHGKYHSGRSGAWLKMKCIQEQEFVVAGFTLPSHGGQGVGALLLGYYEGKKLRYAGRSGTGFTQATHHTLRARLDKLTQKETPFDQLPKGVGRGVHWVKPELVAQISFATWTKDNLLRQAAFKGLREDKSAKEVVRESAAGSASHEGTRSAGKGRRVSGGSSESKGGANVLNLSITHPDKILDEESGMTKQALAEYYLAVAEVMLPHVADRPLSIVRCPEGSGKPCFYQKHVGRGLPKGVRSISIPNRKSGTREEFLTLNSAEGLVAMAQMGVLEIHPWGSRNGSLDKPDRIIFDLDPDASIKWETLAATAVELRGRLKKLGLLSFLKSTGGKGLHVVVPIEPKHDWATIKQFAHDVVLEMEAGKPDLYITKMTKAARTNRIYLDYLRNDWESTAVAPWSPRARSGAPVAMPLQWKELSSASAPAYHVMDFPQWKSRMRSDPWKAMNSTNQKMPG